MANEREIFDHQENDWRTWIRPVAMTLGFGLRSRNCCRR